MALVLTSTARTARLVYTGDPSVTLTPEALARRSERWRRQRLAAALADMPVDATEADKAATLASVEAALAAVPVPLAWVPPEDCATHDGATVATVRALSWLEDQEAMSLPPVERMRRTVERGLVAIGAADDLARFLAAPPAPLYAPLYHAICDLTWGN